LRGHLSHLKYLHTLSNGEQVYFDKTNSGFWMRGADQNLAKGYLFLGINPKSLLAPSTRPAEVNSYFSNIGEYLVDELILFLSDSIVADTFVLKRQIESGRHLTHSWVQSKAISKVIAVGAACLYITGLVENSEMLLVAFAITATMVFLFYIRK